MKEMKSKSAIIVGVVAVLLSVGFTLWQGGTNTVVYKTEPQQQVGAVSTLDGVDFPYVSIGGLKTAYFSIPIAATSSVICSIKNPYGATSTVQNFGVNITGNGLGNVQFDLSTSSSAYANVSYGSSTPAFIKAAITGSGQSTFYWESNATTTNINVIGMNSNLGSVLGGAIGKSDVVLGPNDYVTVRVATGTPGTYVVNNTGTCGGVFRRF